MGTLWRDIRHGFRMLMKDPGFTVVAVLTLGLGIGATSTLFGAFEPLVLDPFPYPRSDRIASVWSNDGGPLSAPDFLDFREQNTSFADLGVCWPRRFNLGLDTPSPAYAALCTAGVLRTFGMAPAQGRWIEESVISDGLWRRKFGADPSVLGDTIMLNDEAWTIIGVLPGTFQFPNVNPWAAAVLATSARPAVFVPKVFTPREQNELMADFRYSVIGRLKEGATREQARAELNVIGAQIVDLAGLKDFDLRAIVEPLKEVLVQGSRRGLLAILGAIGALLLIACLNLGILSLASDGEWDIIGVVNDVRAHADREAVPMFYRPYWRLSLDSATVVARTRGDPLSLAGALRAAVHQVDADIPVAKLRTMRELLEASVSQRRFQMLLTSTFALCALLLAGLGVYGVVSYSVTRRTREMGIRAALGARVPELCALVLRQGMTPVVFGLILGVAGALACGRLLQSLLYEVKPHDPWIIAVVVGTVLLTATLACYLPARRAARSDPMAALRHE